MASRSNGSGFEAGFVVYVEGPRDRDFLEIWAKRLSPRLARELVASAFILGGRQPARAVEHLRALRQQRPEARGLCVLDADGHHSQQHPSEPGLAYYTWSRRHIESYLLDPAAIRRTLTRRDSGGRLDRLLREHLPDADDEVALAKIDAKRLLDRRGPLSRQLERPLAPGRIARAMRSEEYHPDIRALLERLLEEFGLAESEPRVAYRPRRST